MGFEKDEIICIILCVSRLVEKGYWVCNVVDISKYLREIIGGKKFSCIGLE